MACQWGVLFNRDCPATQQASSQDRTTCHLPLRSGKLPAPQLVSLPFATISDSRSSVTEMTECARSDSAKGPVINYGEGGGGGGGHKMGEIAGPKLFAPPPSRQCKTFRIPPCLQYG